MGGHLSAIHRGVHHLGIAQRESSGDEPQGGADLAYELGWGYKHFGRVWICCEW